MKGKSSPIIILLIALAVVVLLIVATLFSDSSEKPKDKNNVSETIFEEPIITLNKEVNEENDTIVIITAYASTESGDEIASITLPDGTEVPGATATYTVAENGIYTFGALSITGGSAEAEIEVTEIPEISATNPYIPEGFSVIADNVEEGFVISDGFGNQYVWVPVASGKLTRETMLDINYEESSGTAAALVNSVAK